jgi:hypothetical protein
MAGRLLLMAAVLAVAGMSDPLAIVRPTVDLSPLDQARLDRGELVSRVLPARKGQVAVFAATGVSADASTLAAAATDIADLKKSSFVTAIQRFSDPPQLSDLDGLTLDQHDLDVLKACEVGRCSFKLAAIEIEAIGLARYGDVNGRQVTAALRGVMLDRARAYLSAGLASLPPIANRPRTWQLHEVLGAALDESPSLLRQPPLLAWLRDERVTECVDSFLYWSKEHFGSGKPVILITHVAIYQPSADVAVVVGKQIFASRYLNGAVSMTAVTAAPSGERYLVYLNRSTVDLLGGFWGGFARAEIESRLSRRVPELVARLRDRLERSHHATRSDHLRHH